MDYLVLIASWSLFGISHSWLALPSVKLRLSRVTGKFYRPLYSLFATILLVALVWYEFHISGKYIFQPQYWSIPFLLTGSVFMLISINKYFLYLSGIDVFLKKEVNAQLQTSGLHQYVRHPLYFGTLMVVWSLWLLMPSMAHLIGVGMITLYTLIGTILEEKKLLREYGTAYAEYMEKVPMLIPYKIFTASETSGIQEKAR
jgi:methanethiol S-methyltransferase